MKALNVEMLSGITNGATNGAIKTRPAVWVEPDFSAHVSHQLLSCAAKAQAVASVLEMQEHAAAQLPPEVFQALAVLVKDLEHLGYKVLYVDQPAVSHQSLFADLVDLETLIEETVKPYQLQLPDRRLIKDYGEGPLYVRGSKTQLGIILDNLISNAFKYSAPQTSITITVKNGVKSEKNIRNEDNDRMMIAITNYGSAISPDEQALIFTKFYRGSNAAQPGHGLGLYLSRHLVELHGGQLEVESSPEEGTRFWFTAPAARPNGRH